MVSVFVDEQTLSESISELEIDSIVVCFASGIFKVRQHAFLRLDDVLQAGAE